MLLVDSALVSAHSSAMHTPIGSPVFAALSSARGGGLPLLHELHVDSSFSPTGVSWRLLKVIGKDLPELEVLSLHKVHRNYSNPQVAELTDLGADDFAMMPRLRALVIKRESFSGGHALTSEGISKLFVALFRAAPNLASFEFDHGPQHISVSDRKLGVKADVLPRFGDALVLSNPPRSLTQLRLSHVLVEPADFEHAVLPGLRSLNLYECGLTPLRATALTASLALPERGFSCFPVI
mmetsp:Transcript_29922/g.75271  ORF Transcript_29922/g.75271 Transcript_29922/m.75271 type:complete len:238 (-) Transcript_29922:192-905(-)